MAWRSVKMRPGRMVGSATDFSFPSRSIRSVLRPRDAFSPEAGLAWIGITVADSRYEAGMSIICDLT